MRNVQITDETLIRSAMQCGTPCLCYEKQEIDYWRTFLSNSLPERAKLIYSVKASHSSILLREYIKNGLYFETASDGELSLLLSMEADPSRIWVSGQGKTPGYIRNAVRHGISHFHIESANELDIIASLINRECEYECCVRINPECASDDTILQTAGQASAFGIDEQNMEEILQGENGSIINGIFVYCGSQYFTTEAIIGNTGIAFRLAQKFFDITGRKLKAVDFGGGFGVPERDETDELDMKKLKTGLAMLFEKYQTAECFSNETGFYFESGRYLSARTACLVTRVIDIKESKGKSFLITDGGINHLGVKQKEYRLYPPFIRHIGTKKSGMSKEYCITGTTCTPIDLTHPGIMLDTPCIGDLICIPDCGGYSLSFSPQHFNGFYDIPEVLHDMDTFSVYKNRGTFRAFQEAEEYVPVGTGTELHQVLRRSCPVDSDEVENIIAATGIIRLNHLKFIVYDISRDGTEAVILLKILKKHYQIVPIAVFSDFKEISDYTQALCFPKEHFGDFASKTDPSKGFVMIIDSEPAENDTSIIIEGLNNLNFTNILKIESELITSMELDYYRCYLHHISELQASFELLSDLTSKECYIEYVRTVLENDFWRLPQLPLNSKYWGYDTLPYNMIYCHLEDEKWLNIGSCNGDTIFRYLLAGYNASKIFAVDTDDDSLNLCKSNLEQICDNKVRECISYYNIRFGCNPGEVRIDDMFKNEKLTLINMDIEGAEENAICSAKEVIRAYGPVLAVCIYHKPEDIFSLIKLIHSISKEYSFYLRKYPNYPFHRYNSKEELVLYAVPNERKAEKYNAK